MEPGKKTGAGKPAVSAPKLNYRSVLIVTYGRSGSTLLQGLLNSIPGCLVRGENYNLCYGLYLSYQSLVMSKAEQGWDVAMSPTNPWFGAPKLSPEAFLKDAAGMVRRQLLAGTDPASVACLGFKEVRYPELPSLNKELPKYLDFLAQIFPKTAFVFLTRDLESVVKSGWWQKNKPEDVMRELGRFENVVRTWADNRKNFFAIDYRDLAGHGERVAELFTFIGAPYDHSVVAGVLAQPHSLWPASAALMQAAAEKSAAAAKQAPAGAAAAAPEKVAPAAGKMAQAKPVAGVKVAVNTSGGKTVSSDRKPDAAAPWLQVEFCGKAFARVWAVDPLPALPEEGGAAHVGGVLLARTELPEGLRMMLRSGGQSTEVQWQLPSPGVARAYPGDPAAAKARFRLKLSAALPASEIVLEAPDGQEWLIAKLSPVPGITGVAR